MTARDDAHTALPITDAAHGSGIPGVVVTLTDSSGVVVATATADDNGEYRFRGLSDGTYTLTAQPSQHDAVAQAVTVSNGTAVTRDLELGGLCQLSGIVRAAAPTTSPTTQQAGDGPGAVPEPTDRSSEAVDVPSTRPGESGEESEQHSTRVDDDDDPPSPRRRRLPGRVGLVSVIVLAVVAGAGLLAWTNGWLDGLTGTTEAAPALAGPAATAVVEVGTIAATESWDGTLDHGAPFTVTSSGEGTITRIADQGETVSRGDELYRVNEQPVVLLYGAVPMFRDLGPGDSGADVAQLETNLDALGYAAEHDVTVDDEYTPATAEAVRDWQEDIGASQTGTVARSDVIFVPEDGQVDALRAGVGDVLSAGTPLLDITGTDQVVSLEASIDDRDRFEVGTAVTVLLPGGDEVAGTVSATAAVDVRSETPEGGTDTEPILQVDIALDEQAPAELVGLTVEVIVAIDERVDVLLVPVSALLAPAGGGYGLEIVADDGITSIVRVETGLFAEGKVEIRSDEVAAGTVVGVAGR